jgi:transposase
VARSPQPQISLSTLTILFVSLSTIAIVCHDNSTRATVIVLKAIGKPNHEITGLTRVKKRTINSIYARAIKRGFNPGLQPLQLEDKHLEDAHRSRRPSKRSTVSQQVVDTVRTNQYGREKSCANIASLLSQQGFNMSASTVKRVLKEEGFRKTKPTRKPRLTKQIREERYR